ncbi:MAG TPA: hypothetical protein ENI99_13465 [Sedimenticola sp.]|nr:hypothetical protein [Sedimenticola sp.]
MKQQVNLVPAKLKSQGDWPSGRLMFLLTILLCLSMVVISVIDGRQLYLAQARLSIQEQKQSRLQEKIEVLKNEAAEPKTDPTLDGKIKDLEERLAQKDRLRNALRGDMTGNTAGYSDLFIALAKQSVPGVWLTHVIIADTGADIKLAGYTRSADLVPLYLERLSSINTFSGSRFHDIRIKKADVITAGLGCCTFVVESESP